MVRMLVVLAWAASAFAAGDSSGDLAELVRSALEKAKVGDEVAEVLVDDGTVILRGKPRNAFAKMKAIEVALGVEGVEAVEDELLVAEAETPEDFVQQLVSKVLTYPHYTVFDDITFQIQDGGLVVLSGFVTMPFKKNELEERVGKVTGVRELKSVIQVLPVSQSDEDLRQRLFNNIYGHELFRRYANRTHPPIRIVVDRANVTLGGAVLNKIERIQAESITRSTFGVIGVDNRLQISP